MLNIVSEQGWTTTSPPPSSSGTMEKVPPTSSLQTLGFFTVAELVELCPPYGRGHLGWPPCKGSWRWSQEGGLVLIGWIWGRRGSRMRAQQGGARNYIFIESESFFSNGQSIFEYCSVLEKARWAKDPVLQYTVSSSEI